MFVVDTNVLIYAADSSSQEHAVCRSLLERSRSSPETWYLSWGIIYEFLRVITHLRVLRNPWSIRHAWTYVEALLASPSLVVLTETERHRQVAAEVCSQFSFISGNRVFDARTAILMKEHGIRRIYTRDMDFHRFPFIEVIDPVSD